ncbi:MAG: hypothetical protein GF311_04830 [Candidatus Lokiarchaeota archaeon]|nr:hypothetical protein [Candidatus Lokiarchaeota archaeon]
MKTNCKDLNDRYVDEFKDPRIIALVGMLESFVKNDANNTYKIILRWS